VIDVILRDVEASEAVVGVRVCRPATSHCGADPGLDHRKALVEVRRRWIKP
jgi:hypothetical protein